MTLLELVNAMQRKLRESTTASVSTTSYSKLLGEFINEAKQIVEDQWDWVQLRSTIQVTTAASTTTYTLTNLTDRGRILVDTMKGWPYMDVYNDTADYHLKVAPSSAWMTEALLNAGTQTGKPYWFDVNGQSGGDPQVDLYPTPDGVYTINFNVIIPQDDFTLTDTTSDSTELTVPDMPVLAYAMALAKEERGEDPQRYFEQYQQSLYNVIEKERETVGQYARKMFLNG